MNDDIFKKYFVHKRSVYIPCEIVDYISNNKQSLPRLIDNISINRQLPRNVLPLDILRTDGYKICKGSPLSRGKTFTHEEELIKSVTKLLNALSEKNFEKITCDIIDLNINNAHAIKILVSKLIAKSSNESLYVVIYCQMCVDLSESICGCIGQRKFTRDMSSDSIDISSEDPSDCFLDQLSFKSMLIYNCNELYNELYNIIESDFDDDKKKYWMGYIIFIGELSKNMIIDNDTILEYIHKLFDKAYLKINMSLELLHKLLKVLKKHFHDNQSICSRISHVSDVFKDHVEKRFQFYILDLSEWYA